MDLRLECRVAIFPRHFLVESSEKKPVPLYHLQSSFQGIDLTPLAQLENKACVYSSPLNAQKNSSMHLVLPLMAAAVAAIEDASSSSGSSIRSPGGAPQHDPSAAIHPSWMYPLSRLQGPQIHRSIEKLSSDPFHLKENVLLNSDIGRSAVPVTTDSDGDSVRLNTATYADSSIFSSSSIISPGWALSGQILSSDDTSKDQVFSQLAFSQRKTTMMPTGDRTTVASETAQPRPTCQHDPLMSTLSHGLIWMVAFVRNAALA